MESDLLPYLWLLKAEFPNNDEPLESEVDVSPEAGFLVGGGICIHESGYIVTVSHALGITDSETPTITAKRSNDGCFREAKAVLIDGRYGLCLLQVSAQEEEGESNIFPTFPLPSLLDIHMGDQICAFIHEEFVPFTFSTGSLCHSFRSIARTSISDPLPFTGSDLRTYGSVLGSRSRQENLFLSSLSNYEFQKDLFGYNFISSLGGLERSIPLLQVKGFVPTTLDGQCGWPVFTRDRFCLVGLMSLSIGFLQFIIPASIVREFLDQKLPLLHISIPLASPVPVTPQPRVTSTTKVLPFLWVLTQVSLDGDGLEADGDGLEAGGVCVGKEGIVVTVIHGIQPDPNFYTNTLISARRYGETGPGRSAVLVKSDYSSGLCYYKLHKKFEKEVFEVCSLPRKLSLDAQLKVFSFTHDERLPLAFMDARVAYPFMDDPSLAARTIGSALDNLPHNGFIKTYPEELSLANSDHLSELNPNLALIEVHGLARRTLGGQCGCGVFAERDNEFLGIFAFSTGTCQFLIPSPVIREILATF